MLRLIYKWFRPQIHDLLVEEFYGMIPKSLKQPSVEFLARNRDQLERFFSVQAYTMQRRSIMDDKRSAEYQGILIHIKSLLLLLQTGKPPQEPVEPQREKQNPLDGVKKFVEGAKPKVK